MQSDYATQRYAAHTGPVHADDLGRVPDLASLGLDIDTLVSLLDDPYFSDPPAWPGSLILDSHNAAVPSNGTGLALVPYGDLSYAYDGSAAAQTSGINQGVSPEHFGALNTSLPGNQPLWTGYDHGLLPDSGVPTAFDGWIDPTSTPFCLTTPIGPIIDASGIGSYDNMFASSTVGQPCDTVSYSAYTGMSNSPSAVSPASTSDWTSIFSPTTSVSSTPMTSASTSPIFSSPEPAPAVAPSHSSKTQQGKKASSRSGRARSSASRPAKPSFLCGRVRRTAPRNKQVPIHELKDPIVRDGELFCSHCSYHTRRAADMPRHMDTHIQKGEYVCCGVPVEDAPGYSGEPHQFEGRMMVGGCLNSFKRKDSFLRHLDTFKGKCLRPAYLA